MELREDIQELLKNKEYEKALSMVEYALKKNKHTSLLYTKAVILYNMGRPQDAERIYNDIIKFLTVHDAQSVLTDLGTQILAYSHLNLGVIAWEVYKDMKQAFHFVKTAYCYLPTDNDLKKKYEMFEKEYFKEFREKAEELNKPLYVLYFKTNEGFSVYDNSKGKDTFIESVECKKKGTQKFKKLRDSLIHQYDITKFICDYKEEVV